MSLWYTKLNNKQFGIIILSLEANRSSQQLSLLTLGISSSSTLANNGRDLEFGASGIHTAEKIASHARVDLPASESIWIDYVLRSFTRITRSAVSAESTIFQTFTQNQSINQSMKKQRIENK